MSRTFGALFYIKREVRTKSVRATDYISHKLRIHHIMIECYLYKGNKCIYQTQGKVITREDGFMLLGDTHVEKNRYLITAR